ncbi:hypothetical protein V8G54_004887 [Vigna mungo]|uniref:Uncharacterized protein n=1 Tax=Vigna mungo TaxID=3915 RepID=A0AAQ3SEQ6_VIGMU
MKQNQKLYLKGGRLLTLLLISRNCFCSLIKHVASKGEFVKQPVEIQGSQFVKNKGPQPTFYMVPTFITHSLLAKHDAIASDTPFGLCLLIPICDNKFSPPS